MKYWTILLVLIAVTGVNLVFRNSRYNSAEASRGPESAARRDRAAGVDRLALPDRPAAKSPGALQEAAADLSKEADRNGDVVLARIAAECGNHLFTKAQRLPDNPHLLNQAAQHYRACLAHEPTCREAGVLFRDARVRLEQIERLLARRDNSRIGGALEGRSQPAEKPAVPSKPLVEEPQPPAEKTVVEKDEGKMVGPDGVIYQRTPKR